MSQPLEHIPREQIESLLKQTKKRLKRANEKAGAIKKQHAGKTNGQQHPSAESTESGTVLNYHGGWSLGHWEGRAAALEDVTEWLEDALSGRHSE